MFNRLNRVLRDQTGSALIDAMVGVVLIAVALVSLVTATSVSTSAMRAAATLTDQGSALRSYVNDLASDPLSVPETPAAGSLDIGGKQTPVTRWRDMKSSVATIHAVATARCPGADVKSATCPSAQISVNTAAIAKAPVAVPVAASWSAPAIATADGASVVPGAIGTFTVPAGQAEVRYVVRLTGVTGPGAINLSDGAKVLDTQEFDSTTGEYVYSVVPAAAGSVIQVTLTAPATLSRFLVYEVAR